ncbi:MAG: GWxTD domain-containing protein, partial [Candidatus Hodarchaeota archaeon]
HTVELVADEYKIIIELTDLDTKKTLHREKTIKVREFRFDNVGLSDIVFADDIEKDSSDIESIIPNLNRSFNNPDSYFGAYFEIYPMTLTDSLTLIYTITDATDKPIVSKIETHIPNKFIVPYILYLKDQITRASRYNVKIEVKQKDKSEKIEAKFSTSWRYFKFTDLNINQAIGPLKDFVTNKDWNWIQQASDSAKEEWYKNYWKERDPTPDTEENELMLEFYDRVDFANYHFLVNSLDMDGWETDTWYHVAWIRNGDNWAVYRNGIEIMSETKSITVYNPSADLIIGS